MVHYFKALLGFAVIGSLHLSSWAQSDWPKAKPVTLVVAFAAGSSTDIVARSLTQKLNELTGGNFIVENKGGAGGCWPYPVGQNALQHRQMPWLGLGPH